MADTTDIPLRCPHCGRANEAVSGDGLPKDGDVSLCFTCTRCSFFVQGITGMTLRKPTDAEADELLADEALQASILAARTRLFRPSQLADKLIERGRGRQ